MIRIIMALSLVILFTHGSAVAQSSATEKSKANASSDDLPIIDVHTHTQFSGKPEPGSGILQTREEYFKQWREAGVIGAVAHTDTDGSDFHDLRKQNVIYCAGIGERINIKQLEADLKSAKYGCIKVYLGYVHRYAYDRQYEPVYKLAEKYDVPVVFHTGDTYSIKAKVKYADPLTIDEVAVDHPKIKFVIAHCGNPWIESAAEVAYKNPNVYLECSGLLIGKLNEIAVDKVDTYIVRPISWIFGYIEDPKKLMFGTDWPLVDIKGYVDAYKRAIPKEHWRAVFHDNAVQVFKLKPPNTPASKIAR